MAINLGNLQLANAFQARFSTGVGDLRQHFVLTDNAATASLQTILANAQYINYDQMANNTYVIVHSYIGANPAFQATVAHFDTLGNLEFTLFRVEHIGANTLTFIVTSLLHDDHSAATCAQRSLASFGPPGTRIHFRIPAVAVGAQQGQFLVASMALADLAAEADPFLAAPAAAVAAVDPIANHIGALILNQNAIRGAARVTATNSVDFERMSRFQRVCPPGAFAITLNLSMIGLTAGEAPSAGFFNLVNHLTTWRGILYTRAQMIPSRTTTITDAKLAMLALLRFPSTAEVSISDLAAPGDLPITFDNVCSLIARACELFATMWGAPFAAAVLTCARNLCDLKETHSPELTVRQLFSIIERRIHQLPDDDAFSIANPDDGLPPGPKLAVYFRVHHTDNDIHLMLAQARAVPPPAALPPAAAAVARNRKRGGVQPVQPARATRPRGAAAAPAAAAAAAAPRATRQVVTAWYNTLTTAHPALLNNLPCLYWLSKKVGHPCNATPNCPCANAGNIRPHVTNPAVVAHMADITAWLATDPWHRFG